MNRVSRMRVKEAEDGDAVLPGHVFIAPGDRHLMVRRSGARYICQLSDGAPVNRHRPSVDVLFRSVAQQVGPNAVAMLLTGMGVDGARGLAEIREQEGRTLAQDENTSVVWGMPGEAVRLGAVEQVLPLADAGVPRQRVVVRPVDRAGLHPGMRVLVSLPGDGISTPAPAAKDDHAGHAH